MNSLALVAAPQKHLKTKPVLVSYGLWVYRACQLPKALSGGNNPLMFLNVSALRRRSSSYQMPDDEAIMIEQRLQAFKRDYPKYYELLRDIYILPQEDRIAVAKRFKVSVSSLRNMLIVAEGEFERLLNAS